MLLDVRDSLFVKALASLVTEDLEPIGQELAALTNQVVIAEACDPGELTHVRRCAETVHDHITIGLAYLTRGEEASAPRLLQETQLRPFFQIGLSLTLRLQQQMRELDATLQRQVGNRWEEYLDSPFREVCVGVQRQPPLFFRGLETPGEILYRRFRSLAEVRLVETTLRQIPLWFSVLRRLELFPEKRTAENITLEAFWNTTCVRWIVEGKVELQPLTRTELQKFQRNLQGASVEEKSVEFVAQVAIQYNLTTEETEAMQSLAQHGREQLEEVVRIDVATADLRFLDGLLVTE
jgi:hypothetical protein